MLYNWDGMQNLDKLCGEVGEKETKLCQVFVMWHKSNPTIKQINLYVWSKWGMIKAIAGGPPNSSDFYSTKESEPVKQK